MSESQTVVKGHPKSSNPITEGTTVPTTVTPDTNRKLRIQLDVPSRIISDLFAV